jgi:hypothetical protein
MSLLSTTDLSVEDIAYKVGYNYSANFSKMFKKNSNFLNGYPANSIYSFYEVLIKFSFKLITPLFNQ